MEGKSPLCDMAVVEIFIYEWCFKVFARLSAQLLSEYNLIQFPRQMPHLFSNFEQIRSSKRLIAKITYTSYVSVIMCGNKWAFVPSPTSYPGDNINFIN